MNYLDKLVHLLTGWERRNLALLAMILIIANVLLTACGVDLANPPRLATEEAQAAAAPTTRPDPLILPAPTATPSELGEEIPIATIYFSDASSVNFVNSTIYGLKTLAVHDRLVDCHPIEHRRDEIAQIAILRVVVLMPALTR